DQDHRFGSEDIKQAFFLVKLLEESGYTGMKHFDSHAYRTEDEAGVWDFALGSMRTYLIFREKAAAFNADAEIQQLLSELASRGAAPGARISYIKDAQKIKDEQFDLEAMRAKGYAYERLDQLTVELLLGVR
ncbi:MAG: xylose isomerase, partial [bacterium]